MGLSKDREQELMIAEAIRTQDGESRWARDGYVVIGPTDCEPDWLPTLAEEVPERQRTLLTVSLSRPWDRAAVMASLEPIGVHLMAETHPLT